MSIETTRGLNITVNFKILIPIYTIRYMRTFFQIVFHKESRLILIAQTREFEASQIPSQYY